MLGMLALSAAARAGTCESDFQAVGDPRNGMLFMGTVQKPGLSVESALGQLQKLAADERFAIGNESIVGDSGEVFFTRTRDVKTPIVYHAQANAAGEVSLGVKLARGQQMNPDEVRGKFCGMLNSLKPGKEGEAIAAAARAKSGTGQVIDAEAPKLSREIGADIKKTMAGVNSKGALGNLLVGSSNYATEGERKEAFAPIRAKYLGRKYRIDGQIYTISADRYAGVMQIAYLVTQSHGLLGIRESSTYNSSNFTIQCTLAPDQAKLFATLSEGDWVKLQGTVSEISTEGMMLRDCRQSA
ncbi:hypothetical protein [[Pseudomonas] boreopolis]|uniref:hypothetical protein n=1 Tax=Xanthomonas boreopolis TaxID=86183 RepID=UPI003DA13903